MTNEIRIETGSNKSCRHLAGKRYAEIDSVHTPAKSVDKCRDQNTESESERNERIREKKSKDADSHFLHPCF